MKIVMPKYLYILIAIFVQTFCYAVNFQTVSHGEYNSPIVWNGNVPGSSTGYGTGSADTLFINHSLVVNSNFEFYGNQLVVIINTPGSLTIASRKRMTINGITLLLNGGHLVSDGNFKTSTASKISLYNSASFLGNADVTVGNGSILNVEAGSIFTSLGSFSTLNSNTTAINLAGTMNIDGTDDIASQWNILSSGNLNVTNDLKNNNSGMDFRNCGNVVVDGNLQMHSGNWSTCTGSSFDINGSGDFWLGEAHVVNDGIMRFPNISTVTKYGSYYFDCDGVTDQGSVVFGITVNCPDICSSSGSVGSGSGGCYEGGNIPLPVELTFFQVLDQSDQLRFEWETAMEYNNDYFVVEYSRDLIEFQTLKVIKSHRQSSQFKSYSATLYNSELPGVGNAYFRLKQVDIDGKFSFSQIVMVERDYMIIDVFPNITNDGIITVVNKSEESLTAQIVCSVRGIVVQEFKVEETMNVLDLSINNPGLYILQILEQPNILEKIVLLEQ